MNPPKRELEPTHHVYNMWQFFLAVLHSPAAVKSVRALTMGLILAGTLCVIVYTLIWVRDSVATPIVASYQGLVVHLQAALDTEAAHRQQLVDQMRTTNELLGKGQVSIDRGSKQIEQAGGKMKMLEKQHTDIISVLEKDVDRREKRHEEMMQQLKKLEPWESRKSQQN